MTTTRRELITTKYNLLGEKMRKYTDEQIFPSLEDIDVADLVYFISLLFWVLKTTRVAVRD